MCSMVVRSLRIMVKLCNHPCLLLIHVVDGVVLSEVFENVIVPHNLSRKDRSHDPLEGKST